MPSLYVIVATPLHASVAVAVPVFAGRLDVVQAIVVFAGHVITGASVSVTITTFSPVSVHPFISLKLRVNVKVDPQATPDVTVTVCVLPPPEMDPFPEIPQV